MGGPSLLVPPKALLASSWFIAVKWTVQGCVKGCTASALWLQAADRLPLLSRVGCVTAVQAARAAASEARRRRACRSKLPAVSAAVTFNPNSCSRWLPRLGLDLRLCHLPDVNGIRWVLLLALQGAHTWLARWAGASTRMLPDCRQHAGCAPATSAAHPLDYHLHSSAAPTCSNV